MKIKELMKETGISSEELMKDIEEQKKYTYSHRIKYKNYVIAQERKSRFNDIIILKNGKEVLHASCIKQFTDKELRDRLLDYIGE